MFNWIRKIFKSLGSFVDKHHGSITVLVVIATLCWTVWWSLNQDKKGDARTNAYEKQTDRLVSEQDQDIRQLIQVQEGNTMKLTENYTKIVSGKISDLEANMIRLVSRNVEMLSGETVRKIIASHENIQRGRDDTYKKALDEASEEGYIFEINQTPDKPSFFVTGDNWKPGEADKKGSSSLLTIKEKADIDACLKSYFEKEKTEKRKDGFANKDTQKEIFSFLLRESNIGCLIISPVCEITYRTPYHTEKTELLTPFGKLGAVIGHIGDKITKMSETSEG